MKWLRSLLIFLFFLVACTPTPPPAAVEQRFPASPYGLRAPFLAAWEQAGGLSSVGVPQSAALWLDGRRVQFFQTVRIETGGVAGATVFAQPSEWKTQTPADLLAFAAATQTADLAIVGSAAHELPPRLAPLVPISLTVRVPNYTGPIEVRLYDATLRPAGQLQGEVRAGAGAFTLEPRGMLGPQWAIALIDGRIAGANSLLLQLDATTEVTTGDAQLDALCGRVRAFLAADVTSYTLNGQPVRGYRSPDSPLLWLRDHVYQGRGFRYFEQDVTSLLKAFRQAQLPDGSFPDVLDYPERLVQAQRLESEADLEYLFVQGVYEAWQMTGDDQILRDNVAAMRKGLAYITSDPLRWDATRQLVRRPYTIDTWDFQYGPTATSPDGKPAPRHWIDAQTRWGIFHGDNTGLAYALLLMGRIEDRLGNPLAGAEWRKTSGALMQRLNALSWNGRFFTHFVPLEGTLAVPGVDTNEQLSLSNTYALNRAVLERAQGQAIVESYYGRRDFNRAFNEWYSIDPPFPAGSFGMAGKAGEAPGEYVNGGLMPLVGGELARGAFRFGAENYGFDLIQRYAALLELTGKSYLWYYPDGRAGISGPDTLATDGWGASAMLGALIEGAGGIEDLSSRYQQVLISPRWSANPNIQNARVVARYAASNGYVAYQWQRSAHGLTLVATGSWEQARIRILVPDRVGAIQLTLNGTAQPAVEEWVGNSRYITVRATGGAATVVVKWGMKKEE